MCVFVGECCGPARSCKGDPETETDSDTGTDVEEGVEVRVVAVVFNAFAFVAFAIAFRS